MAQVSYSPGIDHTRGALDSGHELITRKKHLHDTTGALTKECDTEIFLKKHKRDYKHNPPQGEELAHLQHFGEAARRTTALMHAYKFLDTATDEERELLEQYRRRFQAQIKGEPDLQAPLDKQGRRKFYFRFDNFVRAMIYQELKND